LDCFLAAVAALLPAGAFADLNAPRDENGCSGWSAQWLPFHRDRLHWQSCKNK
jgi:hypothetical protein